MSSRSHSDLAQWILSPLMATKSSSSSFKIIRWAETVPKVQSLTVINSDSSRWDAVWQQRESRLIPDQSVRRCGCAKVADTISAGLFLHVSHWLESLLAPLLHHQTIALHAQILIYTDLEKKHFPLHVYLLCRHTQWFTPKKYDS